jgi:hypothetical protein
MVIRGENNSTLVAPAPMVKGVKIIVANCNGASNGINNGSRRVIKNNITSDEIL